MARRRGRRRRSFKEWVNSPRVSGWTLVVIAVVFGVIAVGAYRDATALRERGVRTHATVTEVQGGKEPFVVVKFTTNAGHHVTAEVDNYYWSPKPHVGDDASIVYDPKHPKGNIADVRTGPDFFTAWTAAIVSGIAALLAWPTFTGRINWARWAR